MRVLIVALTAVLVFTPLIVEAGSHRSSASHARSTTKSGTTVHSRGHGSKGATHGASYHHYSTGSSHVYYRKNHLASGYSYHPTVQRDRHGRIKRSSAARDAFKREHPCPSTGRSSGRCPGYVIDHRTALECGGADAPFNMQWQTVAEGKAKDRTERYCR